MSNGVLVHEWIAPSGGSENVLEAMSKVFPSADIVCLWNDGAGRFDRTKVRESWIARTALRRSKALSLPLMPLTWRTFKDRGYDWALISSHAFAHHARFRGAGNDFRRMVYVHTPARYVWTPDFDSRGRHPLARVGARTLQMLDRKRAHEGAEFAANSNFVRARIAAAWGVEARVIYPPVDVELIQSVADWRDRLQPSEQKILSSLPCDFVLGASRLIPYKRLDEVIRTGEKLKTPVVVAGSGPSLTALRDRAEQASVPVTFLEGPSKALLYALYQQAQLYVFPAIEDFGIMPVEAMAAGAAVLAQSTGGSAESVEAGSAGALTDFRSDSDLIRAAHQAMATSRSARQERAREFSVERFNRSLRDWV